MTNEDRQNKAAEKVIQLHIGGLEGVTTFQIMQTPDGEKMFAICFSDKLWAFDQKTQRLVRRTNG